MQGHCVLHLTANLSCVVVLISVISIIILNIVLNIISIVVVVSFKTWQFLKEFKVCMVVHLRFSSADLPERAKYILLPSFSIRTGGKRGTPTG